MTNHEVWETKKEKLGYEPGGSLVMVDPELSSLLLVMFDEEMHVYRFRDHFEGGIPTWTVPSASTLIGCTLRMFNSDSGGRLERYKAKQM